MCLMFSALTQPIRSRSCGLVMFSWLDALEALSKRHLLVRLNSQKFDCKSKRVSSYLIGIKQLDDDVRFGIR